MIVSTNLKNLKYTRTCRFEYKRWLAFDTMNLTRNFKKLLKHCNPLLLNELEDIHEEIVIPSCELVKNLRFLSMKFKINTNLVKSICTLQHLTNLHLTEKPNIPDLSSICSSLVKLKSFRAENISDGDLFELRKLSLLETLDFPRSKITNEGLLVICTMQKLKSLALKGCISISDDGLSSITLLTSLKELDLSGCRITDASVQYLTQIPSLTHITLQETCITDITLVQLVDKTKSLQYINIAACKLVTNHGISFLSKLPYLEGLNLSHTCLNDDGLNNVSGLANIRTLNISNTQISDEGLRHVSLMTSLRELVCSWNVVSDVGVGHLFTLKLMRTLNVIGCKNITGEGLSTLQSSTSLEHIYVSGNKITDFYRKIVAF